MPQSYLAQAAETYAKLAAASEFAAQFEQIGEALCRTFKNGGKVLLAGNGGSAADSQHIAGEFVVRFRRNRDALPAIALTVDTSVLTATLNDFGPEPVFSRQVAALGRPGDFFWGFSTSGNSGNILLACEAAKKAGLGVIGFTGEGGGKLASLCDYCFKAPSTITSHVQECHIAAGHLLCEYVERTLFPSA